MRTITTSAGTPVDTDGDVLAVIETISRDLARRADLDYGFEEVEREFQHLINQLTPEELESLLSSVRSDLEQSFQALL